MISEFRLMVRLFGIANLLTLFTLISPWYIPVWISVVSIMVFLGSLMLWIVSIGPKASIRQRYPLKYSCLISKLILKSLRNYFRDNWKLFLNLNPILLSCTTKTYSYYLTWNVTGSDSILEGWKIDLEQHKANCKRWNLDLTNIANGNILIGILGIIFLVCYTAVR